MLGVLGASGLLGWRMSGRRTGGNEPCGPLLAYRQGIGAGAAAARPGDAVWLGVMTLPARERDRVLELMSGLLTALEARTSPTGLDLVSGDLREELAEVRGWLVPVMNAAQEVIQERWVAHVSRRSSASPPERLWPLGRRPEAPPAPPPLATDLARPARLPSPGAVARGRRRAMASPRVSASSAPRQAPRSVSPNHFFHGFRSA
ncbi:MAG: hypothetical protein IPM35_05600 [Myxococcales bacterium]|nr:hypothetical protein [Myxococcales bacterium]